MKYITTLIITIITLHSFSTIFTVTTINNSGTGSLRDAVLLAQSGDTVNFNSSLIASGSATLVLTSDIFINKPITIIGLYNSTDSLFIADNLSISGSNQAFYLNLLSTGNVILKNLFFKSFGNSFSQKNRGGAIYANSVDSLIIDNCEFISCMARQEGGAIYSKSPLLIKNSFFSTNKSGEGGAVYSTSNVKFSGCNFNNNLASSRGSSIIADSVTILNSKLSNNNGRSTIFTFYYSSIINSIIENNIGSLKSLGKIVLKKCKVINNMPSSYASSGISGVQVDIDSSSIINNLSDGIAIIFSESSSVMSLPSIRLTNSFVKSNKGDGSEIIYSKGPTTINNCIIDSNLLLPGSGSQDAIIRSDELLIINNTDVIGNNSDKSSTVLAEDNAQIKNSRFNFNLLDTNSPLLFTIRVDDSLRIINSEINNNLSGGLSVYSYSYCDSINVYGNRFQGLYSNQSIVNNSNLASNKTGIQVSYLTINNSEVYSNSSNGTSSRFIKCNNTSIYNNGGWGIHLNNPSSTNVTLNGTILNTTVYGNNGGISSSSCDTLKITNSTIYKNSHSNSGMAAVSACSIMCESTIIACNQPRNIRIAGWPTYKQRFTSLGYNLFGDTPTISISTVLIHPTDSLNITCSEVNLDTLGYYGGNTKTAVPMIGSVAINNGNPSDLSDAQNGILIGRRDVGAAEKNGLISDVFQVNYGSFSTFPNPSNGTFTLDLKEKTQFGRIFIMDINGRLIKEIIPQNVSRYEISFEGISGVYFLNLVGENNSYTIKLIKE